MRDKPLKDWQVKEQQRAASNAREAVIMNAENSASRQQRRRRRIELARRYAYQKGVSLQEALRMLNAKTRGTGG